MPKLCISMNSYAQNWPHQPIDNKTLLKNILQDNKQRQINIKHLIDKFSNHSTTKICQKIKFRDIVFQKGDYVYVQSHSSKPYICIIQAIYYLQPHIEGIPIVELSWCIQKNDLASAGINTEFISEFQIFPSNRRVFQYATVLIKKCTVFNLQEYLGLKSENNGFYFYRADFDTTKLCFIPSMQSWQKICDCKTIICPNQNGQDFICCQTCSLWFHRACIFGCSLQNYLCKKCKDQRQEQRQKQNTRLMIEEINKIQVQQKLKDKNLFQSKG